MSVVNCQWFDPDRCNVVKRGLWEYCHMGCTAHVALEYHYENFIKLPTELQYIFGEGIEGENRKYIDDIETYLDYGLNLFILGDSLTGKTYFAASMLNRALETRLKTLIRDNRETHKPLDYDLAIGAYALLSDMEEFSRHPAWSDTVAYMRDCQMLVVDGLDTGLYPGVYHQLYRILNYRMNQNKATVLCSRHTRASFKSALAVAGQANVGADLDVLFGKFEGFKLSKKFALPTPEQRKQSADKRMAYIETILKGDHPTQVAERRASDNQSVTE